MDWMKLKSGSDVRGVAVGENAPLTEHVAMCLCMAFARYVAKHVGKPVTQVTIAIGRDSRISGPALLHAAAEGVSKAGASVLDFGMCTTPAMYMCIITPGFQPDAQIFPKMTIRKEQPIPQQHRQRTSHSVSHETLMQLSYHKEGFFSIGAEFLNR